jgi:ribosomal-protein-alanine N-acetyltransferase
MRLADLDAVIGVEQAAYHFPWTEGIFRDCIRVGYDCHVAVAERRICGYGVLSIAVDECHVLNLCVHPDYQGRGIGRVLLDHLLDIGRSRGAGSVFLEVRPSNQAALALYRNTGFDEVGVRPAYYPAEFGREDAVILARSLID